MAVSTLLIFVLAAAGLTLLMSFLAAGIALGKFGSTKPNRPAMSFGIWDCSGLLYGGNIELRWIKYHPKTGMYAQHIDEPNAHGIVRVVEKQGFFGWRHAVHHWDAGSLIVPPDKKHGYGWYKYEVLDARMKEHIDKLLYEHGVKDERIADMQEQVEELRRGQDDQVVKRADEIMRQVQKTMPVPPRKPGTQGGAR